MQLGIFAKVFPHGSVEENLDAVRAHGFSCVQYNLVCAGLPTLPDEVPVAVCRRIREAADRRGLALSAVSGTFNIIDPDTARRADNFRRLEVLAHACAELGTSVITLCSGTCDPDNMWRRHPDNDSPAAWSQVVASMHQIARIGREAGVIMAFEPEVNNVVDTARKARQLLDEIGSPHLKVVLDGANLFHAGELPRMRAILDEALTLIGPDLALAHAKDLTRDGDAGDVAAGTGVLDYDHYLGGLRAIGFSGPLIAHGLREDQVPACVAFLARKLQETEQRARGGAQ